MSKKPDEQSLVLISIVYQLLDKDNDISELNPNVQDYIQGLVEELNECELEEQDMVYFYADTFFNNCENNRRVLH